MVKKYDSLKGVPHFCYYLEEITQFMDFECPEEKRILCYSRKKMS